MIPEDIKSWLNQNSYGDVIESYSVSGGCINNGMRLQTSSGNGFFLKTNEQAPKDMFAREEEGLSALRTIGGPRVPEVFLQSEQYLLLEDLAPATPSRDYWKSFGRQMAAVHDRTNPQFGFATDNYIGSGSQLNPWTEDGHAFFAEHRLTFQATLALTNGLLSPSGAKLVDNLCNLLPELIPHQPASLIHGDLWVGNAIADSEGQPAIIDPAVHYGWAEAELAMTTLFGSFDPAFYTAYKQARHLDPGYRERFPIYNLYHLLNHLNLFGRGYHSQVMSVLNRFE